MGGCEVGCAGAPVSYARAKELQGYSLVLPKGEIADSDEITRAAVERRGKLDVDFGVFDEL